VQVGWQGDIISNVINIIISIVIIIISISIIIIIIIIIIFNIRLLLLPLMNSTKCARISRLPSVRPIFAARRTHRHFLSLGALCMITACTMHSAALLITLLGVNCSLSRPRCRWNGTRVDGAEYGWRGRPSVRNAGDELWQLLLF
jgi:hypothetical protein